MTRLLSSYLPSDLQQQLCIVGISNCTQLKKFGVVEAFLHLQRLQFNCLKTETLYQLQVASEQPAGDELSHQRKLQLLCELERKSQSLGRL